MLKRQGIKTARRRVYAGQVDLSKRRAWFDEGGDDAGADAGDKGGDQQRDLSGLPEWVQATLNDNHKTMAALKQEAAGRRIEAENLQKQIAELKTAQQKRLEDEGQFKAVNEQLKAENAQLKAYQERATALEESIRANNQKVIESIPESKRGLVLDLVETLSPDAMANYLAKHVDSLRAQPAPETDAGAGNGSNPKTPVKLTAVEREAAKLAGISEADYAKSKAMRGTPPELSTDNKEG